MAKPRLRDNLGRFQKYATISLTNHMKAVAEETKTNVQKIVADKLEETYKNNVKQSYGPRSTKPVDRYKHTGLFLESLHAEIQGDNVKMVLEDNSYDDQVSGRTVEEVYKFLTEGTVGRWYLSILEKR